MATLTVSSAVVDRALITVAEGRAALGIDGTDQDSVITTTINRVSDLIARECRIPSDGVNPPTFMAETIVQTFRFESVQDSVMLSRRPVTSISSVVEDGAAVSSGEYEFDKRSGILTRLDAAGEPVAWNAAKVVVTYVAGFATVPYELKAAAEQVLREQWSARQRDPLLRSEAVEGVGRFDYWVSAVGGSSAGAISPTAAAMLDPFRYWPVG